MNEINWKWNRIKFEHQKYQYAVSWQLGAVIVFNSMFMPHPENPEKMHEVPAYANPEERSIGIAIRFGFHYIKLSIVLRKRED
jgi:hypothetical protein